MREDKIQILPQPDYIKKLLNSMVKSVLVSDEVERIVASDNDNIFAYLAEEYLGSFGTPEWAFMIFSCLMKSFPDLSHTFVNLGGIQLLTELLKVILLTSVVFLFEFISWKILVHTKCHTIGKTQ